MLAQLQAQSSVKVNPAELQEVIRELEQEAVVKVTGERDRRTITRADGA